MPDPDDIVLEPEALLRAGLDWISSHPSTRPAMEGWVKKVREYFENKEELRVDPSNGTS